MDSNKTKNIRHASDSKVRMGDYVLIKLFYNWLPLIFKVADIDTKQQYKT